MIGANIGEFSIFVAKKGANVFAIEHDKAVFKMLALNAKKYSQIKALIIQYQTFLVNKIFIMGL